MNNNINELSINEMEQANGGVCGLTIAACVIGITAVAVKVADSIYDIAKGRV